MGALLAEIVGFLAKLPPEIVSGVAELVKGLVGAKSDEDRRKALDAAMAAADQALLDREFPSG